MENNQGGGNKKVYVAIIVLLLLVNAGAMYMLWRENSAKIDVTNQKTEMQKKVTELDSTLDAKKLELDQFKGKNAELDSVINSKQTEIDNQKKQISNLFAKGKMNGAELAKAKQMITEYESSIAELQKKVDELTAQNKQLTNQNQELSTNLDSEKKTTADLTNQNQGLSKKVELGSLLQLRNITVEGISKKKSGKEVTEKKVKKTESLRISFETGDNKVLEAGKLSIYVRIMNPKGETISVADQGSGTFKAAEGGTAMQFTKQADMDWAQSNKKVLVYWSQNIKDAGVYKVEMYQSGYLIGKGQVELK